MEMIIKLVSSNCGALTVTLGIDHEVKFRLS